MQQNKNIIQEVLYGLIKSVFYTGIVIIGLIIAAVIFILIFQLVEEKKFVNNCVNEGDTQEHCQSIWSEIDALN